MNHEHLKRAINLASENSGKGNNGPFGAIVVLNNEIIGEGWNQVVELNDPTAHAEVTAIRNACAKIGSHELKDAFIYSSCEPCPMCLSAIYWARIEEIYYSCSRHDAADIGFDDKEIYDEFTKSTNLKRIKLIQGLKEEGIKVFKDWKDNPNKIMY